MRSPTRRDLLAATLGVLAGCRGPTPELPPGELVGANMELGHRLRTSPPAAADVRRWTAKDVVIVGAGVAGLAAGRELVRRKVTDFAVLELEAAPGGTSRYGTSGVVPHPWGAHYLPAPLGDNADLVSLLGEMGVVEGTDDRGNPVYAEHVLCRDPQERLYAYGQWYDGLYLSAGASADDLAQKKRFFAEVDRWVAFRDGRGRKAFSLPLAAASDDAEVYALDKLSMADWLAERKFTSSRLRWMVDYACRDDYGSRPEDVSAYAGMFYFASRRAEPGAEPQPLLTWPEGNGRLVRHLADKVGDGVVTDVAVADVIPGDDRAEVVCLTASGEVVGYRARRVIYAAPRFTARYVLRPWREKPPSHVREFVYGSWVVANLHLSSRPTETGVPAAWDNVFYESPSLGYVAATHQAGLDFGPTVWTWYYPLVGADVSVARGRLMNLGRDEWAETALADISRAHPDIRGRVERLDVMRWGHAMIRPGVSFTSGGARREALRSYRNVHFAHSDMSGLALFEEAFHHGTTAAREAAKLPA